MVSSERRLLESHVFLLLVDVANLEPNVLLCQGSRGRVHDVLEALVVKH